MFPCRFGRYEAYFREGRLSTESTVLIENYFSLSPNPSTHAYRIEAGKIVPVWEAGKEIRETPLVKLHVRMMEWMMRTLSICPFSPETLYLWAKLSVDAITRLEGKPDLRPLMQCGEFDSCDFVRKLTLPELFRIACGGRVTAFDPASVQLTAGERGRKSIMSLHRTAIRYVYPLYRKFF